MNFQTQPGQVSRTQLGRRLDIASAWSSCAIAVRHLAMALGTDLEAAQVPMLEIPSHSWTIH